MQFYNLLTKLNKNLYNICLVEITIILITYFSTGCIKQFQDD